jgi:hypothetical protein
MKFQPSNEPIRDLAPPAIRYPDNPWCSRPFTPRRNGGKPQRFCRDACRRAYERELRAWARNQIAAGGVTPARLQRARSLGAPSLGSEAK